MGDLFFEGRGVHDRLKNRAGLATSLGKTIELGLAVIAATHISEHPAVARVDRHQRDLERRLAAALFGPLFELRHTLPGRLFGRFLIARIER